MTATEILRRTRAALADGKAWIAADALAVNIDGEPVDERDPAAVRWTMMGAFQRCSARGLQPGEAKPPDRLASHYAARDALLAACGTDRLDEWQARATHEEVLRALDSALARAARPSHATREGK